MWWKRKLDLIGEIFFRGALAPSLLDLKLEQAGIELEVLKPGKDEVWAANLRHPGWGRARLFAPRAVKPPIETLIEFTSGLTKSERERIVRDAQSTLVLEVPSTTGDVLRDRKQFLRFMDAVLGDQGVAGLDLISQIFWTSDRLADELQHDAALDIIQVHVLHVVTQPEGIWLHSHGLAEMGFVDFDVLRPAEELTANQFDLLRSIAFHLVEGASSGLIEPVLGGDPIALVDAQTFMRSAAASDRNLRDPDNHTDRRVVCCDSGSAGFIGRLFGARDIRPSRLLSQGLIEGKQLIRFSELSTDLTAVRARDTLSLLESLRVEFEELQCTALVKMGYPRDDGGGNEHLWFEVHGLRVDYIDATLVNEPFNIGSMKAGDRANRPNEGITDWTIMTPAGQVTPRSLELVRKIREVRPQILELIRSQKNQP
jgi:uncharacterized protein YegJ (DUF2314 family)